MTAPPLELPRLVMRPEYASERDEDERAAVDTTFPVDAKLRARSFADLHVSPVPRSKAKRRSGPGPIGLESLLTPVVLTPLGFPSQNPLADTLDAACQPNETSPSRPESSSPSSRLPPLEVRVLQRPKLFLPLDGSSSPVVGVEELIQLRETTPVTSPPRSRLEMALRLSLPPKKVSEVDEVALMPCHSLQHRGFPWLAAELYREPVRDRDKLYARDELALICAAADARHRRGFGMMAAPSIANRGKWRRWEAQKLHIHSTATSPERSSNGDVLLHNQGVMIGRTYCVVSVYGVGLVGRLFDAGVLEREGNSEGDGEQRCLRVEAYDPRTCRVFERRVTLRDLAWAFASRPELLAPGRKRALLHELLALLYFDYPDGDEPPVEGVVDLEPPSCAVERIPTLQLASERRPSEAALRRFEREERLKREEEERLLELAAFLKLPRRARHRVAIQPLIIHGRQFIVSIYHLPSQSRSFVVAAYHPPTSMTFHLTVSVQDAAVAAGQRSPPHTWSTDQRREAAMALLPLLRFRGFRVGSGHGDDAYRAGLAAQEDRSGPLAMPGWLPPLERHRSPAEIRAELATKRQRELRHAVERESAVMCEQIDATAKRHVATLDQQLAALTAQTEKLQAQDAELKQQIDDIDSRGASTGDVGASKSLHERRRAHKATRQAIKAELKAVKTQSATVTRERQEQLDQAQATIAKQQRQLHRRLRALAERDDGGPQTSESNGMVTAHRRPGQRTWLARRLIQPGRRLFAAGACCIQGTRLRFSLFAMAGEVSMDELHLDLYDPATVSTTTLTVHRLEWLALTKEAAHEQHLLISELAIETSPAFQRAREIAAQLVKLERELSAVVTAKSSKKSSTKRRELIASITSLNMEKRAIRSCAPWHAVVVALCSRLTLVTAASGVLEAVDLDRCLYRAVLPIVSVGNDGDEDHDDQVVYCRVRARLEREQIGFEVFDPLTRRSWQLPYPDSTELVREFAGNSFLEQQLNLEVIAMTLLFFVDESGETQLRFEE